MAIDDKVLNTLGIQDQVIENLDSEELFKDLNSIEVLDSEVSSLINTTNPSNLKSNYLEQNIDNELFFGKFNFSLDEFVKFSYLADSKDSLRGLKNDSDVLESIDTGLLAEIFVFNPNIKVSRAKRMQILQYIKFANKKCLSELKSHLKDDDFLKNISPAILELLELEELITDKELISSINDITEDISEKNPSLSLDELTKKIEIEKKLELDKSKLMKKALRRNIAKLLNILPI